MTINAYNYDAETQQFMPQYSYGAVNTPDQLGQANKTSAGVEENLAGFPSTSITASDADTRRNKNLLKMAMMAVVVVALVLWTGRTALPFDAATAAAAEAAPGTTPGNPFSFSSPWKQWGKGLANYWTKKADDWAAVKADLVSKNATKAEIKEAHDKYWADSKKDFNYIPAPNGGSPNEV